MPAIIVRLPAPKYRTKNKNNNNEKCKSRILFHTIFNNLNISFSIYENVQKKKHNESKKKKLRFLKNERLNLKIIRDMPSLFL